MTVLMSGADEEGTCSPPTKKRRLPGFSRNKTSVEAWLRTVQSEPHEDLYENQMPAALSK